MDRTTPAIGLRRPPWIWVGQGIGGAGLAVVMIGAVWSLDVFDKFLSVSDPGRSTSLPISVLTLLVAPILLGAPLALRLGWAAVLGALPGQFVGVVLGVPVGDAAAHAIEPSAIEVNFVYDGLYVTSAAIAGLMVNPIVLVASASVGSFDMFGVAGSEDVDKA